MLQLLSTLTKGDKFRLGGKIAGFDIHEIYVVIKVSTTQNFMVALDGYETHAIPLAKDTYVQKIN